jgi:hypothetical protein
MSDGSNGALRVVARYIDGRIIKGSTLDFAPGKMKFHLTPQDNPAASAEVQVDDLKALFFVKTWEGDPKHADDNSFQGSTGQGRRMSVTFRDGETIAGYTVGYAPDKPGFFVIVADAKGNNTRAYVVRKSVQSIAWITAAAPGA